MAYIEYRKCRYDAATRRRGEVCPPSAVPIGSLNTGFILAGLSDPHLTTEW